MIKRFVVALASCVVLSASFTGCGGSSGGGGTPVNPAPVISSFAAGSLSITAGTSTNLTGVFSNGTGVITPGSLAATSGTAVSVSPAATTTYTLTVSGSGGTATSTVTVTVSPAPSITSFTASPATITAGGSSALTAVFANGTGVITPGNLPVTSGTAVNVSPTASTTYTLTVTNPAGTAITQTASVTVVPAPAITTFTASPGTITAGSSSALTAVFANGVGVITPGNIAVTSGAAVNVSPNVTTTYTLTVTNSNNTATTQSTTVTVDPAPTITSFGANPATIALGASSALTGVFANGNGVITPGNIAVTSGTPVNVSPNITTTYTLTVTNPNNSTVTQTTQVTVSAGASITSFSANQATISSGSSSALTGVFANGTGVITPGNIAVTSGTAVNVSPTSTTTYTLTVSGAVGAPATQTATVTVTGPPSISSFTANPTSVAFGSSTALTAVFANGTGVITPGNISVTSGTAVNVTPAIATTYTLTVTPTTGTAITQTLSVAVQSSISVNQSSTGPAISDTLLGVNMAAWYDPTQSFIVPAFQAAGIKAVRWPGGSWSDDYHWQTDSLCGGTTASNTTFSKFVSDLVIPAGLDVALTADYGTNPTCNGGGLPSEAAAWAAEAATLNANVTHITVGNEEYGTWETDMHTLPNNAATYAAAVGTATSNGFYQQIKAANSNVLVGIDVNPGNSPAWDPTVLNTSTTAYDFVEYHYYPEAPNTTSGGQPPNDTFLTQQAAQGLTTEINAIRAELTTAGTPNTPIYIGEISSAYTTPGKQSMSITQGLYAGQVLGEAMNDGVSRLTWWIGFGNCTNPDSAGDESATLYGWQNFGAYNIFSDGPTDSPCTPWSTAGTMGPTAQAFNLFQNVAVNGEHVYTATVAGDTTNVRAYAATHSGGTAMVLFNLSETVSVPVIIKPSIETSTTDVTVETYDKAIYDETNPAVNPTPIWAGPTNTDMGAQSFPLTLTLAPWSMNVVIFK
jgi:hypothetical protein